MASNEKETITFVSGNRGKISEASNIFDPANINMKYKMIDLPEYQGDPDFICSEKCRAAAKLVEGPVIVEDTSLNFNALHGFPGPYVKWFYEKLGSDGLYTLLTDFEDKSASAVTVLAYWPGDASLGTLLFHGETKGTIVKPRGRRGFGWDACFLPENSQKTYAEMKPEEKNKISHRRKALDNLKQHLLQTVVKKRRT